MNDPEDVQAAVQRLIADEFELDAENVTPEARLGDDLDLDSLDGVDLFWALEQRFGVKLADDFLAEVQTVGEIQDRMADRLAQPPSADPQSGASDQPPPEA